jgi:heat shock transcription factor 1
MKGNMNNVPGFLRKTYEILENPEFHDIVCWSDDGRSFKVKKPNEFAEKVLPKYFKHNNFASFVRQLNMYDFHKLRQDFDENEWRHKLFRRGNKQGLADIKRKIYENNTTNGAQQQELGLMTRRDAEMQNTQLILGEVGTLKQKQEVLEKALSLLIA